MNRLSAMLGLLALLLLVPARAELPQYVMRDLGTFGAQSATATGINNAGVVVGFYGTGAATRAFLWDGAFQDLGPGEANDINDSGIVVGYTSGYGGQAWYWDGARHDLGPGYAYAISNAGHIGGQDSQYYQACIWQNGSKTLLPDIGYGNGIAYAVNDEGMAAGTAKGPPLPVGSHAIVWQNGAPLDLGIAARNATASGINNAGVVVGTLSRIGDGEIVVQEAFLFDGEIRILPFGRAAAINNNGDVVGSFETGPPVLWRAGELSILPGLSTSSSRASDINDNGLIVGWSLPGSGDEHAVMWVPVPEPTSLPCLGAGLAWTVARRRAQHSRPG